MESNVIVEGFRRSEEDHGLMYKFYIGDGDSSVFARIQERCQYGRFVQKIECANHVTRALNDQLHKLAENTKHPLPSRRLLTTPVEGETIPRLERLIKGVRTAIKESGVNKTAFDVSNLREDLKNSVDHVFGNHTLCKTTYCKRKGKETNCIPALDTAFLSHMRKLVGNLEIGS